MGTVLMTRRAMMGPRWGHDPEAAIVALHGGEARGKVHGYALCRECIHGAGVVGGKA